ncbi:restriction endonuclease subunit S [Mucilaginibacter sp. JRF]|uniref:restriction endonuclease subunit S n=1 Tax=Mucilaginibacter sp. JRF TaxID=2780088 RepID=UPI001880E998|nr:restriction endonuclease subunit S [Mucilaginibacter sp. JRF]MBE9584628.1 restriction endonuclease subunit S [Mucilaginibacter sp. JRF]
MSESNLPKGWEIVKLGEIVTFLKGKGLSKNELAENGKSSCVLYGELYTNYGRVITKIKSRTDANSGVFSEPNDILIPASTTTSPLDIAIASAIIVDDVRLGGDINILRDKKTKKYDNVFLAYFLTEIRKKQIANLAQGSTIVHLYGYSLSNLSVYLPSFAEQKKIAKIILVASDKLDTITSNIDQLIQLKNSLMAKFFSKDEQYRQTVNSENQQLSSKSELVFLEDVAKRGSGHTPNKSFTAYYHGNIKWISLADSSKLDNRWISETKNKISQLGIKNSSAVIHPTGTVLLSRDAGIGKSAVMKEDMAVSQHFLTWTCSEKLNNWYLYYHLQFNKPLFERVAVGSTIKTIGLDYFKKYKIMLPSMSEQIQIAEILNVVDDKIDLLKNKKLLYQNLKTGIVQQLLTGKLRVKL